MSLKQSQVGLARLEAYRQLPHIVERDRLIMQMRAAGKPLREIAEAVKHCDPAGIGWTRQLICIVAKRLEREQAQA